jgi:glycosyltransferase involved in cell wall biosynthesis
MKQKLIRISTVSISLDGLLKGQLSFLNRYFNVKAVASGREALERVAKREKVPVYAIEMKRRPSPLNDLISLKKLYRYFKQERPFIVHSITPKAGLLSMMASYFAGVPHRIHTFTGLIFPYRSGFMYFLLKNMDRLTCLFATKIIPEGEGVKKDLIKHKITNKPLKVIGNGNVNGIDINYFSTDAIDKNTISELKQIYNLKKEHTVFCFVGRLVADKGINELVEAFIRVHAENNSARLMLVGPFERELDKLAPETESLIEKHPHIINMGWQDEVRLFLAMSDVFVFPSYREGFPNVVMQAGAMNLPSIVTDINGCNEIIVNGVNGIIIPPRDTEALKNAMLEFMGDKEMRMRMCPVARKMVADRYERSYVWDELLKEYQQLEGETNIFQNYRQEFQSINIEQRMKNREPKINNRKSRTKSKGLKINN